MHLLTTETCYFCYHGVQIILFRGLLTDAIFNLQSSGGLNKPLKIQQISIYTFIFLITKSKMLLLAPRSHKKNTTGIFEHFKQCLQNTLITSFSSPTSTSLYVYEPVTFKLIHLIIPAYPDIYNI